MHLLSEIGHSPPGFVIVIRLARLFTMASLVFEFDAVEVLFPFVECLVGWGMLAGIMGHGIMNSAHEGSTLRHDLRR